MFARPDSPFKLGYLCVHTEPRYTITWPAIPIIWIALLFFIFIISNGIFNFRFDLFIYLCFLLSLRCSALRPSFLFWFTVAARFATYIYIIYICVFVWARSGACCTKRMHLLGASANTSKTRYIKCTLDKRRSDAQPHGRIEKYFVKCLLFFFYFIFGWLADSVFYYYYLTFSSLFRILRVD